MKNKLFACGILFICVSTIMLFGQFRTEDSGQNFHQPEALEIAWAFSDDTSSAYQNHCFYICDIHCYCVRCCLDGSGGLSCGPSLPPPDCEVAQP